jgi:hypothetical protein
MREQSLAKETVQVTVRRTQSLETTMKRCGRGTEPSAHVPLRAKAGCDIVPRAHGLRRKTTDTIRAGANIVDMSGRDASSVAADAARIAARVTVLEASRRRKVQ